MCVFVSAHVCVGIDCSDPNTTTSFVHHFIQSFCIELMLQSAGQILEEETEPIQENYELWSET